MAAGVPDRDPKKDPMDALPFAVQLVLLVVLMAGWPIYLFLQLGSKRSGGAIVVVLAIVAWLGAAKIREYFLPLGQHVSLYVLIAWCVLPTFCF
jgi:hypothetical protein